jgi:hypothetical protein
MTDAGRRTGRVTTTGPHYVSNGRAYVAACPKVGASVEMKKKIRRTLDRNGPG